MYRTSDEGMRAIRTDLFRNMPLCELESKARERAFDSLAFEVLEETYHSCKKNRDEQANFKAMENDTHWLLNYPDAGNQEESW